MMIPASSKRERDGRGGFERQLERPAELGKREPGGLGRDQQAARRHGVVAFSQHFDEDQRAAETQKRDHGDPAVEPAERADFLAGLRVEQRRGREPRLRSHQLAGHAAPATMVAAR